MFIFLSCPFASSLLLFFFFWRFALLLLFIASNFLYIFLQKNSRRSCDFSSTSIATTLLMEYVCISFLVATSAAVLCRSVHFIVNVSKDERKNLYLYLPVFVLLVFLVVLLLKFYKYTYISPVIPSFVMWWWYWSDQSIGRAKNVYQN